MFRLRGEAEVLFRYIQGHNPIKTKVDLYYLCLLLGLRRRQLDDSTDTNEVYAKLPQEFAGSRHQIIALLLSAEMEREGLDFADQLASQKLVSRYIDSLNPASLSKDGFSKCNSYASGGFNALSESLVDPPRDVNAFLVRYVTLLEQS